MFFHLTITTHHCDRGGSGVIKNAVFRGGHGVGVENQGEINTNSARYMNYKSTFKDVKITLKDNKIIFNLMQIV